MKKISNPVPIIKNLFSHILLDIENSADEKDLGCATNYMNNLLEDYDYNILKEYWECIYKYLTEFALNPNASLRKSACYGIGILA